MKLGKIIIILLLAFAVLGACSNNGNSKGECGWCGGTGYSGNGAKSATEYVFKKTTCRYCHGTGWR